MDRVDELAEGVVPGIGAVTARLRVRSPITEPCAEDENEPCILPDPPPAFRL